MKKKFLVTIFFATIISVSFAQREAGGSAGDVMGGGSDQQVIVHPCPITCKRINGNGNGVCGGDAQIRLTYSDWPSEIPVITGIFYNGNPVAGITLPVPGDMIYSKGYISYCLMGNNIPPANKITLKFRYSNGQECVITEQ